MAFRATKSAVSPHTGLFLSASRLLSQGVCVVVFFLSVCAVLILALYVQLTKGILYYQRCSKVNWILAADVSCMRPTLLSHYGMA